jgi:hypothetical protein
VQKIKKFTTESTERRERICLLSLLPISVSSVVFSLLFPIRLPKIKAKTVPTRIYFCKYFNALALTPGQDKRIESRVSDLPLSY